MCAIIRLAKELKYNMKGLSKMDTTKCQKYSTKIIAHRGLSGLECENTAAAFIAAGQRSHFGIETDIHKTIDGYFVCCHDSSPYRVSDKDLVIEQSTLAEVEEIRLYERGSREARGYLRIPRLSDYISICKKYGKHCVPEIKGKMTKEMLENVTAQFASENMLESTTFIAFDFENLEIIRKILPRQSVQLLTSEINDEIISLLVSNRMDIDVQYNALSEENVRKLHENGIKINCWSVNDKSSAEKLSVWGVDYITSDILE